MTIHPSKDYLDYKDIEMLKKEGFVLKQYPDMMIRNFRAKLLSHNPEYFYAIFFND